MGGKKVRLEGWLLKKKSGESKMASLFKQDNQRWFRIEELGTPDETELALCYYKSRKDSEAKGWVYLRDVTQIRDDRKSFVVVSASRTMSLEAHSQAEHVLWIQTLMSCTPWAETARDRANSSASLQAKDRERRQDDDADSRRETESRGSHRETSFHSRGGSAGSRDRERERERDRERERLPDRDRERDTERDRDRERRSSRTSSLDDLPLSAHPSRGALSREDHRLAAAGRPANAASASVAGRLSKYIVSGERERDRERERDGEGDGEEEEISLDATRSRGRAAIARREKALRERERERRGAGEGESESESGTDDEPKRESDKERERERERDRESKETSSSSAAETERETSAAGTAAAAKKPVRAAMPSVPPPRRVRDALAGDAFADDAADAKDAQRQTHTQQNTRRSLEDVLLRRGEEGKQEESKGGGESSDEDVDVKAEIQKYAQGVPGDGENATRPPRPSGKPLGAGAMPINTQAAPLPLRVKGARAVPGTPPRPGGDPGTAIDRDFLHEDWDDEDDGKGKAATAANAAPVEAKSAGVRVDANWLDEDFDN